MKRLIKRYIIKAQADRESDEITEGKMLKTELIARARSPACLFLFRWAERDQTRHLQPEIRAAGGEGAEHGDAGRTAEEDGRDQDPMSSKSARFLLNVIHDIKHVALQERNFS